MVPVSARRNSLSGRRLRPLAIAGCLAALLVPGYREAGAATFTWNGSSTVNSNWSTPENWVGTVAPSNPAVQDASTPDAVVFAGTVRPAPVTDQPWFIDNLTVNGGPFSLSGSLITLRPSVNASHDSRNFLVTSGAHTINNNLKVLPSLTGTQSGSGISTTGTLVLNGNLDADGLSGLRLKGSGTITVNGIISGNIGGTAINGGPTVIFNSANTYTNTFSVYQGTAVLGLDALSGVAGALGNSTSDINLGASTANGNATLLTRPVVAGTTITVSRNIGLSTPTNTNQPVYTIGGDAAGVSNYTGAVFNGTSGAATRALNVTAAGGGRVNFTGSIQRRSNGTGTADDLTKLGIGVVVLSGSTNNWAGNTIVSAGTLLVNGIVTATAPGAGSVGNVTVSSGATLGGTGTINRATLIQDLGIFAPGDIDTSGVNQPGKLTLGTGLTLNQNSSLRFDLGAPANSNDQAVVAGTFTLDGILNVTSLAGFGLGSYPLFQFGASTFTDNGLQFGSMPAGFSYNYSVSGGTVFLNVVPEPTTAALLGLGAGLALFRRRRSR